MAQSSTPRHFGYKAGEDLSSKQFRFVKFGSVKDEVLGCGANERAMGILQNAPEEGEEAEVALPGGGGKLEAGEAIALGKLITSTSTGKGEVADAAGEWVAAIAHEPASEDGDIIGVEVIQMNAHASDA